MPNNTLSLNVRKPNGEIGIIDIVGEFSGSAETALTDAYAQIKDSRMVMLNFSGMDYMNSSGIGLLITLMIRIERNQQKLFVYGLKDHYRQIFKLTRLDEAVTIYSSEEEATSAALALS